MNLPMKLLVLLSLLLVHSSGHRIQLSDSILDIINTRHVEQILAERRANASRENEKRYLVQNDLDEDVTEDGTDLYQTPEVSIDFDFHGRRQGGHGSRHHGMSHTPVSHNGSGGGGGGGGGGGAGGGGDLLADLHAYRGDKLLKSSKNALLVTRKEYLKKDWCKTEPLVQRIREEGCLSRTIVNRFCYGQCNSFYIPKSPKRRRHGGKPTVASYSATSRRDLDGDFEDEDLTGPAFRSCAFCKPKKFTWMTVTLRCPSLVPQLRRKRIQRIKQCKCIAEPLH
ncbi:gremlin-1-like [Anopheles funestus]|uniref:CTCK domain-containing protein n=1 Tax=Anopheles funestus TaxID=62324 RepID=A0A4Y0BHG8_ANOFN|nr:gremlin-1-like [Anopheles funestus]XP_049288026.1 gremlin-1-like [Anopheles funestus]